MKKGLLVVLGVAIVVVAGVIFMVRRTPSSAPAGPGEASSTVSSFSITTLVKAVLLQKPGVAAQEEVAGTSTATSGSTVKTGDHGRALVEASLRQMVLDHNTELVLTDTSEGHTTGELSAGSVWSQVQKVFEKGEFHEIETKNVVAAVRGTSFNVSYFGTVSTVLVTEGAVWVAPRDLQTGEVDETKAVIVPAGKKATRDGNGPIIVSDITAKERADDWYSFNATTNLDVRPTSTTPGSGGTHAGGSTTTPKGTGPLPGTTGGTGNGASGGGSATTTPLKTVTNVFIRTLTPQQAPQRTASETPFTLSGGGFFEVSAVSVGGVPASYFQIDSDTDLLFSVPLGIKVGTYDVSVTTKDKRTAALKQALTITVQ